MEENISLKKHVTVIDDDVRMLKLMKEYLHDDFDVAVAPNAKVAMRFLETKGTDIILLDYVMPEVDGPTLYRQIRCLNGFETKPIVFLSGMTEGDEIENVMKELKPQGYLIKPVEKKRLLEEIYKLIGENC